MQNDNTIANYTLKYKEKENYKDMSILKDFCEEKIKSVRIKLFLIMSIMVIAIILFLIFANTFLIEKYYMHSKKDSLLQAYSRINNYISNNTNLSNSELDLELERIAINNNFSIVITD